MRLLCLCLMTFVQKLIRVFQWICLLSFCGLKDWCTAVSWDKICPSLIKSCSISHRFVDKHQLMDNASIPIPLVTPQQHEGELSAAELKEITSENNLLPRNVTKGEDNDLHVKWSHIFLWGGSGVCLFPALKRSSQRQRSHAGMQNMDRHVRQIQRLNWARTSALTFRSQEKCL